MSAQPVVIQIKSPLATVTLNRPEVHNAFDEALIAELTACYKSLSVDPSIRVVVLRGEGASFCAGADLAYMARMAGYTHARNLEDARTIQRMMAAIYACPKVTIARVHGTAIGGGVGLVAACDIAIAAEGAKFGLSEVRIGLVPAVIGPFVLQKVGMGACRTLFVTGERISAAEALRLGLVQEVVPLEELDAAVERKLALVRQSGPEAVAAAKRLLRDIDGKTPHEAAEITVESIAALRVSEEGQEGIRAFLGKRLPGFVDGG